MARILALAAAAAAVHALEPHRTLSTMDLHLVDGSSTGAVCLGELLAPPLRVFSSDELRLSQCAAASDSRCRAG